MSYAEHGPRIFLTGRPGNGMPLTYGDYVLPKKRLEGRLKLFDSCTDIRAWSPNTLESSRYFRELNEHAPARGKVVPLNFVMNTMLELTAQAQNELRVSQRELQKYKSLKLSPKQREYLQDFNEITVEDRETEEMKIQSIIRPFSHETLFKASKLASLQHSDAYLSIFFHPDKRIRYNSELHSNWLLTKLHIPKENPLARKTYLVSRITSCDILTEVRTEKDRQEYNNQKNICVEYTDIYCQTVQDVRDMGVQTNECKETEDYDKQFHTDSSFSQYYGSSESMSTTESELRMNSDLEVSDTSHKGAIIQKDSEIIVLKNELAIKEDEVEELRERNRRLQALLEENDDNTNILKHNFKTVQEKLKIVSDKRNDEVEDLSVKLASLECLVDQLKAELSKKCQVCHFQWQEIQELGKRVKETEVLSMENESLTRKVKEMDRLSKEAESCGIALEQVKNVWRERNMLQEQCHEQSRTLADKEDEIKQLSMFIKEMFVATNSREVEMNDVVAGLKNEIQTKNDKISRCEMQLVCMEQQVSNLASMIKSSLNNLDECKIAYEGICEYTKCEHDACLDVQSALSGLKALIAELEESKLERPNRLREIDNLKTCVACYSQESVSEITNTDFDSRHESIQPAAGDFSTSSNCDDCHSFKELVNVQIQSDETETTTTCSEEPETAQLNQVISYDKIDRALATHFRRSINKMHEISSALQGAGDYHVQIVKEHARQQQELQKKDLEITELKEKVAERMSRRGEGDCAMQEQLRKRMLEKEKALEAVINKRDSEIERLHEHLIASESQISSYRAECDALKSENVDLVSAKSALSKDNEAQSDELKTRRDQICELIQQIEDLKQTIVKEEIDNIDNMRKQLMDLQMRNNDLASKLIQANETISQNAEAIADLKLKDEQNKMALTHGSITYDAMITQKHSDIVKLQDENQLLREQLKEVEIKLAQSNDTIALLREEGSSMAAISALQTNLSDLQKDKERLLARVEDLESEISNCEYSASNVEIKLRMLSRKNETLRADIETVKSTNDQLLHEDTIERPLKDALCTLPEKIYEQLVRIRGESEGSNTYDNDTKDIPKRCSKKEMISKTEDGKKRRTKIYADKSCQQDEEFCASQFTRYGLDPIAQAVNCNSENTAHKLKFLERQHEEKQQEMKILMDDVRQRDYEIKDLQQCITFLLQEKNDLQNKAKHQMEDYQNNLILLKKKYDSSLSAFRKKHNENVERLQARFDDMKIERSQFDAENWLQSLNMKELAELHNRISILSSHANDESDITHVGAKNHYSHQNNSEERRLCNKFTLQKERTRENRTSLNRKENQETSKILNTDNNEKIAIKELYSRELRLKQEHRFSVDGEKHRPEQEEPLKSRTVNTFDYQRKEFIYQCSVHHRLNNGR